MMSLRMNLISFRLESSTILQIPTHMLNWHFILLCVFHNIQSTVSLSVGAYVSL